MFVGYSVGGVLAAVLASSSPDLLRNGLVGGVVGEAERIQALVGTGELLDHVPEPGVGQRARRPSSDRFG